MNIKYSLVICTLLIAGVFSGSSSECICNGAKSNNNMVNANDPSVISDPVVKIYGHWDFEGALFVYNKTDGYVSLPDAFRNNVQSFQSGIDVCFMKWYPKQQVQVKAGDYHKNYAALTNFGQNMDGLYAGNCEDAICPLSK